MMLQLNPQIPVYVPDKGTGTAFALIDYSQEHYVHFMVALDSTGEVWILDNTKVKFQKNVSLGRMVEPKESPMPRWYCRHCNGFFNRAAEKDEHQCAASIAATKEPSLPPGYYDAATAHMIKHL